MPEYFTHSFSVVFQVPKLSTNLIFDGKELQLELIVWKDMSTVKHAWKKNCAIWGSTRYFMQMKKGESRMTLHKFWTYSKNTNYWGARAIWINNQQFNLKSCWISGVWMTKCCSIVWLSDILFLLTRCKKDKFQKCVVKLYQIWSIRRTLGVTENWGFKFRVYRKNTIQFGDKKWYFCPKWYFRSTLVGSQ